MAVRRFHVDDLNAPLVRVTGDQALHALKVLRLGTGDRVVLFDGAGGEALGQIKLTERNVFEVEIVERHASSEPMVERLILAVCTPKGERADWMIEKCAELGVSELIPLRCERSQVHPGEGKLDRWRRKAVEAAKQSRQAVTMHIAELQALEVVLEQHAHDAAVYFGDAQSTAPTLAKSLADTVAGGATNRGGADLQVPRATLMVIGPEGGLTDAEQAMMVQAGGRGVRLAGSILRIETAAVAAAAQWAAAVLE